MTENQPTNDESTEEVKHQQDISRRKFLKNSGLVAGGLVGGSLFGGLLTNRFDKKEELKVVEDKETSMDSLDARQFFTREHDFRILMASTEQIFPEDEHGPGAIQLGVPYYIDKQLAGRWGINGRDYRQTPFVVTLDETDETAGPTGEQSIVDRGNIFLLGLRKMDEESQKRFNVAFDEAEEAQQIEVMKDFEDNKVKMKGLKASEFFSLLFQSTMEGAYSDPLYGGNKNMDGWRMKEFPGAQASYAGVIQQDEFEKMEPISLRDYQGH